MIEKVKQQVIALLCKDNTGHGFDHIERVLKLALKFLREHMRTAVLTYSRSHKSPLQSLIRTLDRILYNVVGSVVAVYLKRHRRLVRTLAVKREDVVKVSPFFS